MNKVDREIKWERSIYGSTSIKKDGCTHMKGEQSVDFIIKLLY